MEYTPLNNNLKLLFIEENNYKQGKLLAVLLAFEFYGVDGVAYISINKLDNHQASYGMYEIDGDIMDSFSAALESNWSTIVPLVKTFVKEWESENEEYLID